tara:strand:- start:889 stop:1281 length:393 start_codon:yes stop_codon:yes gene_type:complete
MYFVLGILAPIILNLMHLVVGVYVVMQRGNLYSLGFTGMGFLTKTVGMLFLTWLGVGYFNLDFRIYVPLLTFFWFFTHLVEAFVIDHYMKQKHSYKYPTLKDEDNIGNYASIRYSDGSYPATYSKENTIG